MIPPGQNPEEENPSPNGTGTPNRFARHLRETVAPRITSAAARARATMRGQSSDSHRVPPKTRALQLTTAAAAAAVLGSVIGQNTGEAPEQTAAPAAGAEQAAQVQPAAHVQQAAAQPAAAQPAGAQPAAAGAKPAAIKVNPAAPEPNQAATNHAAAQAKPAGPPPKDQLDAWIKQAHQVLQANGYPADKLDAEDTRTLIENESGGDPKIVNNWDSNAQKGTPSKGLMQTIDPTFQSFALPGHKDIYNPVDNIIAASRYSINDYGSMSEVPGVASMQSGGSYQGY